MLNHSVNEHDEDLLEMEDLNFAYLPGFASYLLEKKIDQFSKDLALNTKNITLPLPALNKEGDVLFFPVDYSKNLLLAISKNQVKAYVDEFMKKVKTITEPILFDPGLMMEDISKGDVKMRRLFRKFLNDYTDDLLLRLKILEEVDRFASYQEEKRLYEMLDLKSKRLKENEFLIARLAETSPGIISIYNMLSNKPTYTHPKFYKELGYAEDEKKHFTYANFLNPADIPVFEEHLKHLSTLKDQDIASLEIRVRNKAGNYIWFRNYETVFKRDAKNAPLQILVVTFNIDKEKNILHQLESREKQLEISKAELSQKNLELELKNKELSSFNYVASHDLQEPLRKIRTYSNMIIEKHTAVLNENTIDFLNRIIKSAAHMQQLIDDLLMFSRTTSSEKVLQATDLNVLFEEVQASMKLQLDEQHASVICDPLPTLHVIPFQFHQLMANILNNAVKYRKKEVLPIVHVKSYKASAEELAALKVVANVPYTVLSFEDNGIGFEQQYAEKIFDLFQRLHPKSEYSGTGIGLSICKRIVENHHGFIKATSEVGKGSVFRVYLPDSNSKNTFIKQT